jgi:hypothetical protein
LNNDAAGDLVTRAQADGRYVNEGMACPPGRVLVGYGRSGPLCSSSVGSLALDTLGDVGSYTSLVLDGSGFPVISYYDVTNGDLKLVRCGDATCGAGNVFRSVDTAGDVGQYTSLVLDASGFPVISYSDVTNGDLKVVHCGDATCGAGNVFRSLDTVGYVGRYTSLVLDGSGFPVISYYDLTNGDLRMVHCGDPTCGVGNVFRTLDTAGDVGFFTSLVLDASGLPVISYHDGTNGDLKVVRCGDATCGAGNVFRSVDTVGEVGWYTSLALDGSGYPVISYRDNTNLDLKVVRCGDATCGAGNVFRSVDTVGNVGGQTSLVLDGSGFPVISYSDGTNGDLKVVRCGDATCGAGNVFRSVDSAGDVGLYTSLVLDGSGFPVISYYDLANGDLKVAAVVG